MQRTPGMYTEINTQTQRTGLPNQSHSIVLITSDAQAPATPTPIYDTATADTVSGANSNAGRMMAAALSVSQGVRVDTVGKGEPSDGSGGGDGIVVLPECTPTTTLATLETPEELDSSSVHARYRVNNGEWVDYINDLIHTPAPLSDEILDFLSSIRIQESDLLDVDNLGDLGALGGIRLFNTIAHNPVTAFNARFGDTSIRGVSRSLIDNNASVDQHPNIDKIISNQPTKVEFVVTENSSNDLVYAMFGKDETVYSCAFAAWQALSV
ncbi:hypothetical protein [Psychrobacter fulvigenes]|uniref:hypothetical protein n=1 Tax=Psychrobacter fulvigenes TaxID=533323 RepID=UPI001917C34D|nr:hypothetical protein [Psychrobacter fulvigenes]